MEYMSYFSSLVENIETIVQVGGYPFLFLTVLLEGLPLFGTLVPGHVTIVVAGFLARVGIFNIWVTLIISITAAIAGDYIGFALGRKYGLDLIFKRLKRFSFISESYIERTQKMLGQHTGKAMILGRLSPMTRALMPFLVGANNTDAKKFWIYNIIGGIIWSVGSVMLGYIFGAGYQAVAGFVGRFTLIALVAILIIIWGYKFVNIRFQAFKRYELFVLVLNILSLVGLSRMVQDAWSKNSSIAYFDVWVNLWMEKLASMWKWFGSAGIIIDYVGSVPVLATIGALVAIIFLFMKKWRSATIILLSIISSSVSIGLFKEFFMRARPHNALILASDYSFPSGHAAFAAAFFTVVAYLFMTKAKSWVVRESVLAVCVISGILIGMSRLFINIHWASDVIAGWCLGVFCATISILLVKYVGTIVEKATSEIKNPVSEAETGSVKDSIKNF